MQLDPWAHFKDTAEIFALSDLMSIQDGSLLPQIQAVHKIFLSHIVSECEVSGIIMISITLVSTEKELLVNLCRYVPAEDKSVSCVTHGMFYSHLAKIQRYVQCV